MEVAAVRPRFGRAPGQSSRTPREQMMRMRRITLRLRRMGMTYRQLGEILEISPEAARRAVIRAEYSELNDPQMSKEAFEAREARWAAYLDQRKRRRENE